MTKKRDNAYYRNRLERMNRYDLLERVDSGEIKMHKACIAAGIRKSNSKADFDGFNRAWMRLSRRDKERFVLANAIELNSHLVQIKKNIEAQKTSR